MGYPTAKPERSHEGFPGPGPSAETGGFPTRGRAEVRVDVDPDFHLHHGPTGKWQACLECAAAKIDDLETRLASATAKGARVLAAARKLLGGHPELDAAERGSN